MTDLDKFRGMNPPEIDLISKKIHELLRDHARFIELVNSLSGFFPEYELLMEYLKVNNVQVLTGISKIENNNFYWINIWESENYREQFLAEWINSVDSGKFAKALSSSAVCQNPSTYLFL